MNNKIYFVYFFILIGNLLSLFLWSDVSIEYTFANGQIIEISNSDYYEFDIMANAGEPGTRIGTGIVLINYNSDAFGDFVSNNNNVIVTKGTLTTTIGPPLYNIIVNDNLNDRLAITFEYVSVAGWGNPLPVEPAQLVTVQFMIQNPDNFADLSFASDPMTGQQYQDDNATLYNPVIAIDIDNAYLNNIPPSPNNLTINITGNIVTLYWQSIPGCNYNVYSSDTIQNPENWQIEAAYLTQNSWSSTIQENIRFYYVTSEFNNDLGE